MSLSFKFLLRQFSSSCLCFCWWVHHRYGEYIASRSTVLLSFLWDYFNNPSFTCFSLCLLLLQRLMRGVAYVHKSASLSPTELFNSLHLAPQAQNAVWSFSVRVTQRSSTRILGLRPIFGHQPRSGEKALSLKISSSVSRAKFHLSALGKQPNILACWSMVVNT